MGAQNAHLLRVSSNFSHTSASSGNNPTFAISPCWLRKPVKSPEGGAPSCQFFRYVNKKWARSPLSVRPQCREPNNLALQNHLAPQHGVRIRNSPYAPNHFVHTRHPRANTIPRHMRQFPREPCLQYPKQNDMAPFPGAKSWKSLLTHTGTPWNSIGFLPSCKQKPLRTP